MPKTSDFKTHKSSEEKWPPNFFIPNNSLKVFQSRKMRLFGIQGDHENLLHTEPNLKKEAYHSSSGKEKLLSKLGLATHLKNKGWKNEWDVKTRLHLLCAPTQKCLKKACKVNVGSAFQFNPFEVGIFLMGRLQIDWKKNHMSDFQSILEEVQMTWKCIPGLFSLFIRPLIDRGLMSLHVILQSQDSLKVYRCHYKDWDTNLGIK